MMYFLLVLFFFTKNCFAENETQFSTDVPVITDRDIIPTSAFILDENERINGKLGKTYFLQLRRTKSSDSDDGVKYVRTNQYSNRHENEDKADMFLRNDNQNDNLQNNIEDKQKGTTSNKRHLIIDESWNFDADTANNDLPNITYEIYQAMLENNKQNITKNVHNASMIKFFFEIDAEQSSNIIKFDIDSLKNIPENILDAELHVFRLPIDKYNESKIGSAENVVRLFQRVEDNNDTQNVTNPDLNKLAHVIYISSNYVGWQVFKVKNVLENWKKGEENYGFLISTTDSMENEFLVDFAHKEMNGGKYQPTLVVYLDSEEAHGISSYKRTPKKTPPRINSRKEISGHAIPCARHVWYISFHELGWNNFVIAPTGFMAYRCTGSCKSPLNMSYSNHAKLLNVAYGMGGSTALPCCVPNSYKRLLMMFYDKQLNVVIKEYDNMIVTSCECR